MVVLLRSLGIPSRLAIGFVLEEEDPQEVGHFIVRDRHAYAWAEVYFPGVGWVQFNPSPDRAPIGGATIPDVVETPPAVEDFEETVPSEEVFPEEDLPLDSGLGSAQTDEGGTPLGVWIALGMLGALALIGAGGYFAWERGVAGLPYPQRIWEKTVRLASWAGTRPRANQTPQEFIADVAKLAPDIPDTSLLAEQYGRSRFGRGTINADEERRLREIWDQLRNKLIARILKWK
jgi:hypothetical protein